MNIISTAYQKVRVNRLIKVKTEPLKISNDIELPSVGTIQVRLISSHEREGMIHEKRKKESKNVRILPKSKALILNCHGGGFVAQSSQSHLLYLNDWAEQLNVPILSIDYSLAPEAPYPVALNEVLYIYCWALQNAGILGSTCETIVFAGDSAGANLLLAATLKCIDMNLRKPDGIFIAYCPVLVGFDPSPSRLLCMMDPLIPYGFLMRCLKAYSNAESLIDHKKSEKESTDELGDIKRAKAVHNEELKRKSSLNNELDLSNDDVDNSDSFEEISCFERHHSDSNLQAHISQVSEIASNDTLAGTSFVTNTDNRNTIEIVSPSSIRSVTSLEEDSIPIKIQKSDENDDDLKATSSHHSSDDNDKKYVDEFIEKYVLDAKQCDDGVIKPILRKTSKTKSEENIVFDISRDTLRIGNFQEKLQRVASSLVDSVSLTLNEITKTSRPITRNMSCDESDDARTLDNDSVGVPESSSSDFIFNVPKDPFLSPIYANDDILSQFPAINIVALALDSLLDDNIEFAKKLRDVNVKVKLDILDGLPHGFLNFSKVTFDIYK
jgi:hormone-sensitive lipase